MSRNTIHTPLGVALLKDAKNGSRVVVQMGRHTDGFHPLMSAPVKTTIYLHRDQAGDACGLTINGYSFADFDPRRQAEGVAGDIEFHCESYILRILEIDGSSVARVKPTVSYP
jgi:hypothetical protein